MRKLTEFEEKNLKRLAEKSVDVALLEPTLTALEKGIIDAIAPVRDFFVLNKIHDYSLQEQGQEHKVYIPAVLIQNDGSTGSRASLYRPPTKKGDPRIWFKELPAYVNPNDIIALLWHEEILYLVNITQMDIGALLEAEKANPLKTLVQKIFESSTSIAMELLGKLKVLAKNGLLEAVGTGDTSIGRTVEAALGIPMNSSPKPDYKGIELKSSRKAPKGNSTKNTLFGKVPDWEISKMGSIEKILDTFGYQGEGALRLYCTLRVEIPNPQTLYLKFDEKTDFLHEMSSEKGEVATWKMSTLRGKLAEKHAETFWIKASSHKKDDKEFFQLLSVKHTKGPLLGQFAVLIQQGKLTMDHAAKRLNGTKAVKEKGPLFRIKEDAIDALFPPSQSYDLLEA